MKSKQEENILRINYEIGTFLNNKIILCYEDIKNVEGLKLLIKNLRKDLEKIEENYTIGFIKKERVSLFRRKEKSK